MAILTASHSRLLPNAARDVGFITWRFVFCSYARQSVVGLETASSTLWRA